MSSNKGGGGSEKMPELTKKSKLENEVCGEFEKSPDRLEKLVWGDNRKPPLVGPPPDEVNERGW